jgi:hypothetical protein
VEGRKHPDLPASGFTRYLIPFLAQDPSPAPAVVGPAEQFPFCFAFLSFASLYAGRRIAKWTTRIVML